MKRTVFEILKKFIISMLLSMFFIHSYAQTKKLYYLSLSDFQNDTTAFVKYNFIARAEQYMGKTVEFIVRDLQIPVKGVLTLPVDSVGSIGGLYLSFYEYKEGDDLRESMLNKPYFIGVKWKEKVYEPEDIRTSRDNDKIINFYKDLQICEINVSYLPRGKDVKSEPKLWKKVPSKILVEKSHQRQRRMDFHLWKTENRFGDNFLGTEAV